MEQQGKDKTVTKEEKEKKDTEPKKEDIGVKTQDEASDQDNKDCMQLFSLSEDLAYYVKKNDCFRHYVLVTLHRCCLLLQMKKNLFVDDDKWTILVPPCPVSATGRTYASELLGLEHLEIRTAVTINHLIATIHTMLIMLKRKMPTKEFQSLRETVLHEMTNAME